MSPTTSDHKLELMLLGGFEARLDGRPVAGLSYNKMRALLAYLAMEREQDHSRDVLAGLLWSGNDATTARGNLRRTLSDLRRTLELPQGLTLFSTSKHTIRFIPHACVDALDFLGRPTDPVPGSNLDQERIVALYRGEFLAGLSVPDSPAFEDWLHMQREALRRRALALLEQLSTSCEQAGDYAKALQFSLRHTELEPWNEAVHGRAMRLYAAMGQKSAAIVLYETFCRRLKKELGVLPSEETRLLAERIRNGELLAAVPGSAPSGQARNPAPSERRQVSVLYCELTLPEIDDPDETMARLHAPQARCVGIIRQFGGHVVQTHGGGLLAYFGYPQAHEYAARNAVQAGLAVAWEATEGLEIRVGVHTGLIITGGESDLPDTSGTTSRLAIQLRHYAARRSVAISGETHDIAAGYFECLALGAPSLPGFPRPLAVFRVLRETGARTRLDAAARLTPLTGRKAEIELLTATWSMASQGARQIVLIQGETGIGKTRLLHAMKERLVGEPHTVRELRCFPEFSQSPFHPLIAMLEATLGFTHDDAPEARFRKLETYVVAHFPATAQEAIPLLASLLFLPLGDRFRATSLSPKKQKEQTLAILLGLLQALAAQQPVLLVIEDLHWIDPSTLELLTQFVESANKSAILALLTARPEFVDPWRGALKTTLTLGPLGDDAVVAMVEFLAKHIPAGIVRRIVERADGVPLFVEEITKVAAADKHAIIPTTLLDLLAVRMGSTGDAKHTAQLAATIGREFDLDLLYRASAADSAVLARHLDALQDAGLILQAGATTRQFKHALIQEAAYHSQTKASRQAAHLRIAQVLQSDFPDVVATQPELLAQHLANAGEIESSIDYWTTAGQNAARRSANLEAVGHFKSALQLLMTLPANQARDKTEFNILVSLCPVLHAAEGYGSKDASQANARIAALIGVVGDSPEMFPAKWAVTLNTIAAVGSRGIPTAAAQLLQMAQDDPTRILAAHHVGVNSCFWLGEFQASLAHYEQQAIVQCRPDQRRAILAQYGSDLSVFNASHGMCALYFLGFPDRAQTICAQMLKDARASRHTHTLAQALSFAAVLHRFLNKADEARALSAEALTIAREQDFLLWIASAQISHGWALVAHGENEAGIAELKSCIAGMRMAIGGISVIFLSSLVEAYIRLNRYDDALDTLGEALADATRTGDGHYLAELYRLQGVCLLELSPDNNAQAESLFVQALAISQEQQAKALELRAATGIAGLWQQQGKRADALHLLTNVYGRFTEGFDTYDLHLAAELLRALT